MPAAIKEIFCSYAYEDRGFVESFRKHLRLMERAGLISSWYDAFITPGQPWRSEIEQHLQSANILLLFISPDFLNSDFCMDVELSLALERSQKKEALVIPIIFLIARPERQNPPSPAPLQILDALLQGTSLPIIEVDVDNAALLMDQQGQAPVVTSIPAILLATEERRERAEKRRQKGRK